MKIFLIVISLMVLSLSACTDGGTSREELLKLAGAATDAPPATVAPVATPAPLHQNATFSPAETPDVQTVLIEPQSVATASPVALQVMPAPEPCDTRAIVLPLDDSDVAAGVVARGAMSPCAYATAQAQGVMP